MNEENQANSNLTNDSGMAATALGSVSPETVNANPSGEATNAENATVTSNPNPNETVDSLNPMPSETLESNPEPTPVAPVAPEVSPAVDNGMLGTTNPNPVPDNNLGPIEQPIPGTTYSATSNVNSNGFVETNNVENVGTEPPAQKEPKAKKPMNKVVFIILIVALLGAIAYGVYYYLKLGQDNKKISVTTKTVESALNAELSTNIADYATITGTSATNCQLNTGEVDITKEGAYEFTVTCGNDTYKGAIKIVDTTPLTAQTKEVYAAVPNEGEAPREYQAEEFIIPDTCSGEECTYAFAEGTDINSHLTQTGNYDVNIVVTDQNGKTNTLTASLVVLSTPVRLFVSCSLPLTEPATGTVNDYIAIGASDLASGNGYAFINYAYRLTTYNFANKEDYEAAVGEKPAELTYNNVMGQATYDDANLTLTLRTNLSTDALNSEAGGTFPSPYTEVYAYYQNKGYTCSNVTDF